MKIFLLKIKPYVNPLGFDLGKSRFSYVLTDAKGKKHTAARYVLTLY